MELLAVFALIVWSLPDGVFPSQNPGLSDGTYLGVAIVAPQPDDGRSCRRVSAFVVSPVVMQPEHRLSSRRLLRAEVVHRDLSAG